MIKILAFDVSETLQTGAKHDDNGLGQPMMFDNEIISGAYSVMIGGKEMADLLNKAKKQGIAIVLVTNNGDSELDNPKTRTLNFFQNYGLNIEEQHYYGPRNENDGDKVLRLNKILEDFNISKEELLFFDDSSNNVEDAKNAGFNAIHVSSASDIIKAINPILQKNDVAGQIPWNELSELERQNAISIRESKKKNIEPGKVDVIHRREYNNYLKHTFLFFSNGNTIAKSTKHYLGFGNFGKVQKGFNIQTGETVAVKKLYKPITDIEKKVLELRGELLATGSYTATKENLQEPLERYVLIQNFIPGVSLDLYLSVAPLSYEQKCKLAYLIISAVNKLHCNHSNNSKCIVHGDLKPNNLMMSETFNDITPFDFGGSVILDNPNSSVKVEYPICTERYRAPELDISRTLSVKSDNYSVGVILKNDLGLNDNQILNLLKDDPCDRSNLQEIIPFFEKYIVVDLPTLTPDMLIKARLNKFLDVAKLLILNKIEEIVLNDICKSRENNKPGKMIIVKDSKTLLITLNNKGDVKSYQEATFSQYINDNFSKKNLNQLLLIWKNSSKNKTEFQKQFSEFQECLLYTFKKFCKLMNTCEALEQFFTSLSDFERKTPLLSRQFTGILSLPAELFWGPTKNKVWKEAEIFYKQTMSSRQQLESNDLMEINF